MADNHHEGRSYRRFFPVGLAFALWGAAVWIAFAAGAIAYPGPLHADLMIGCFLFAFAAGFLFTSLPRFSGASPARPWEELLVGVVLGVEAVAAAVGGARRGLVMHVALAAGLVLVGLFALRRFRRRTTVVPPTFAFIGVGLGLGLVGAVMLACADVSGTSRLAVAGRLLVIQGFMPALVLGVGGRLFPALLGWTPAPPQVSVSVSRTRVIPVALAVVFVAAFPVELLVSPVAGRTLRALVATSIAVGTWRLHQRPPRRGQLPGWLWLAAWTFVLGLWAMVIFPAHLLEAEHVLFIGGLGLTTLCIATRVVVSHEGMPPTLELRSRVLAVVGVCLVAALLTRVFAFVTGPAYTLHLAIAAALWCAGVCVWGAAFASKLLRRP